MALDSLRLIFPYYENPDMLRHQVGVWNLYSHEMKDKIKIILVDDGSPTNPAYPIVRNCKAPLTLLRVKQNIPWNQHGARNLGARVADNHWLFMSDIDHVLLPKYLFTLLNKKLDEDKFYYMQRLESPEFNLINRHCNSFVVRQEAYWKAGGYDEDYCGMYGGDGQFIRQLEKYAEPEQLNDVALLRFSVLEIGDANTLQWGRKETIYHERYKRKLLEKKQNDDLIPKNPIRFDWERLI